MAAELPEADRAEGALHPRETLRVFGHSAAETAFLAAFNAGHLHHAWLLTGPSGIGKATLAWRFARFLLSQPRSIQGSGSGSGFGAGSGSGSGSGLFGAAETDPQSFAPAPSLDVDPDHPVAQRLLALSEPGLRLLRRGVDPKTGKFKSVITIDDVRALKQFMNLSATDGGRRVVIIDSADEMNVAASNALLKLLEEPPANVTLLLISHQPSALLPTIRSRCQTLRLHPLAPQDMERALAASGIEMPGDASAMARLAAGSVGTALRLMSLGGIETYSQIVALFAGCPDIDRPALLRLAESAAGAKNAERFDLVLTLLDFFVARLARRGVAGPSGDEICSNEAATLARLAPSPIAGRAWAEAQAELGARARHGKAVNLDPAALLLDMGLKINALAPPHIVAPKHAR